MISNDFLSATYRLFDGSEIEVLEWSFDTAFGATTIPAWADELLTFYSSNNRLLGHLVGASVFSGNWNTHQQSAWLEEFSYKCKAYNYMQISDHYGFSSAGNFLFNSPLSFPQSKDILGIASKRLQSLSQISGARFGIENLAFAFSKKDALQQCSFISALLERIDGFMLLDLHNLYCQMINFNFSAEELLELYPLERITELHLSGGSWSEYIEDQKTVQIRRDTHDDRLPEKVLELLPLALSKCPNLQFVIFERLSDTIKTPKDASDFREDFLKIKNMVNQYAS